MRFDWEDALGAPDEEGFQDKEGEFDQDACLAAMEAAWRPFEEEQEALRPRLAPEAFQFLSAPPLHDGDVVAIELTDRRAKRLLAAGHPYPFNPRPATLTITVVNGVMGSEGIYTLEFHDVGRLLLEEPAEGVDGFIWYGGFSTWQFARFRPGEGDYLRYEVLLSTGRLSVDFRRFSFSRRRLEPPGKPARKARRKTHRKRA